MRVTHCPVNTAGIPWTNVQALRRRGVDARLVVFNRYRLHPEADVDLERSGGLVRQQLTQWRAFARLAPQTDIFHFYFGLTLLPKSVQFPLLRALGKRSRHALPRLRHPRQAAGGARVGAARRRARRRLLRRDPLGARRARDPARASTCARSSRRRRRDASGRSSCTRRRRARARAPSMSSPRARQLDVELEIVEGLDHREAFERYRRADVIVDQLNAGWYGVFAIEAMALGKPVVTFLHDEAVRRTRGGVRRRGADRQRDEGDARRRAAAARRVGGGAAARRSGEPRLRRRGARPRAHDRPPARALR